MPDRIRIYLEAHSDKGTGTGKASELLSADGVVRAVKHGEELFKGSGRPLIIGWGSTYRTEQSARAVGYGSEHQAGVLGEQGELLFSAFDQRVKPGPEFSGYDDRVLDETHRLNPIMIGEFAASGTKTLREAAKNHVGNGDTDIYFSTNRPIPESTGWLLQGAPKGATLSQVAPALNTLEGITLEVDVCPRGSLSLVRFGYKGQDLDQRAVTKAQEILFR